MSTAAERFRERASHPDAPVAIVGVHNALVCRLAAGAGFGGGWVSSLEVSAVNGLPDRNLLGFAEMLSSVRSMIAASDLPLVVDADNGYGTIETLTRAVRELSGSGVAGICIEDNPFPKQNSFLGGTDVRLEPAESFAEKVAAAKGSQRSADFSVIARTEALIRGLGIEEGLRRGYLYADAGADFVLLHSKVSDASEAFEVARRWRHPVPLVTVPTAFTHVPLATLGRAGYRVAIYANQLLRAAVWGMEQALQTIRAGDGLSQLERRITTMSQLLELSEDFRTVGVGS